MSVQTGPETGLGPPRTAAALVIGNEILTGKIREGNVAVLAGELFGLGVALSRVIICGDDVDVIVGDLDALRRSHDYVFTSGGVGPTHDDVTIAAVAKAFGRPVERSPVLEAMLRDYLGERCRERHLRMADVPAGAELVRGDSGRWPLLRLDNVYVLPGLPEIFRRKLPLVRQDLGGGKPFQSRAIRLRSDEGEIAELLEQLSERYPDVAIGSYPRWDASPTRVMVTFDGRDGNRLDQVLTAFAGALPADQIVEEGVDD